MFRPISKEEFIKAAGSGDLNSINRYFVENENSFSEINTTNQEGYTALMLAAEYGHTEAVRLLLAMPDIAINTSNQDGDTALIFAAEYGHTEVVRLLLAKPDIAINTSNQEGNTALMFAAENDYPEVIRLLLAMPNIAINATRQDGCTVLMRAAVKGHTDVVGLLLAMPGIAINTIRHDDSTALICAAAKGHTDVVCLLLAMPGIAINAARQDGWTALMLATEKGHTEVAHLLLEAGADTTLKNKEGKTAEMLRTKHEIRTLIQNATLEKKLTAFEKKRAILMKTEIKTPEDLRIKSQLEAQSLETTREEVEAVFTEDEKRVNAQLEREKFASQEAVDLTFKSALADLDFLLAHRDKIKDFSPLPNLVMRFSELIGALTEEDKKLDAYSRQLRRIAATMGHGLAQHIESHFNDSKTEEERDKSPAPRERSSLAFFSTPPQTPNRWAKEDAQNRRENR